MTGFKQTSMNPCDFVCYVSGKLFLMECKEHLGASIPFSAISQYDRLLAYKGITGVYPGVLVWLSEKDKVFWVPIEEMEKMTLAGEKSVGLKALQDKSYNIVEIPSEKKRVFMESDYSCLLDYVKPAAKEQ